MGVRALDRPTAVAGLRPPACAMAERPALAMPVSDFSFVEEFLHAPKILTAHTAPVP